MKPYFLAIAITAASVVHSETLQQLTRQPGFVPGPAVMTPQIVEVPEGGAVNNSAIDPNTIETMYGEGYFIDNTGKSFWIRGKAADLKRVVPQPRVLPQVVRVRDNYFMCLQNNCVPIEAYPNNQ